MTLKFIASQCVTLGRIRTCLTCATPEQLAVLEQSCGQDVETIKKIASVFDRDEADRRLVVRYNNYGLKLQGVGGKLLPVEGYFESVNALNRQTVKTLASRGIQANSLYDLHGKLLNISDSLGDELANQILPTLFGAKIIWIGSREFGELLDYDYGKINLSTGKILKNGKADICIFTDCIMPHRKPE